MCTRRRAQGFVLTFSEEGVGNLTNDPNLELIEHYFHKVRSAGEAIHPPSPHAEQSGGELRVKVQSSGLNALRP